MTRKKKKKDNQPLTTVQQLGSLTKSARDIMRKDKGLSGDLGSPADAYLDHVPQVPG